MFFLLNLSGSTIYTASMISDILLIFFPLQTLRALKNQPRVRRRLQFIFAASALTTCTAIVSGTFNLRHILFGWIVTVEIEVHLPFPFYHFLCGRARLLTYPSPFTPMQNWVTLTVCNFVVLASAFFKLFDTAPDGTIYSAFGRRVGVVRPPQSLIKFSPSRTGRNGNSGEERSRGVELSKLDLSISTMSMTRTKSPSPPPTLTVFDGQNVDSGV
jgi:hypothetical protein